MTILISSDKIKKIFLYFSILFTFTLFSGCNNEKNNLELCIKNKINSTEINSNGFYASNDDVIGIFNYISKNCASSDLNSKKSKILLKNITKGIDAQDFAYIYRKLNDADEKIRMALIENSEALNLNRQEKLNVSNELKLIDPWEISKEDVISDVKLENVDDAALNVRDAVTVGGINIYYKIDSNNGNHGGEEWISFWRKDNGNAIENSISLSNWSDQSKLRNVSVALMDNKWRLFGILGVSEFDNAKHRNQSSTLADCKISVTLYKIEKEILENQIGNFNCSENYFNGYGSITKSLWDKVIAETSQKTNFPSYIYYLIDTNRCDNSDLGLARKISLLDGFSAKRISELFVNKFAVIGSKPNLDDYRNRKIALHNQNVCYEKIAKTLGFNGDLFLNNPDIDVTGLELNIDNLALKISKNENDGVENKYIGRLDVTINRQFSDTSINTKFGSFSYAYEAVVLDGKLIVLVSNEPAFNSRVTRRISVEEIDKFRMQKNEQLGGFTIDVPVFKIISEDELTKHRDMINKMKSDSIFLDDLVMEYIRITQYLNYSFLRN